MKTIEIDIVEQRALGLWEWAHGHINSLYWLVRDTFDEDMGFDHSSDALINRYFNHLAYWFLTGEVTDE